MSEGNGKSWGPEIKDLGDKIVALTVAKAVGRCGCRRTGRCWAC
jgi:hypothetical protein